MRLISATADDTEALAARLARALPPAPFALLQAQLHGDLGAGKTTFARGFLRGLGFGGGVRSPTYTLIETYDVGALRVVHADLYRLHDADELESLGLRDLASQDHVWLIEWPERGTGWLPTADLSVTLGAQAGHHLIELAAVSASGLQWLSRMTG